MQTQRTFVSEAATDAARAPQGDAPEGAASLAFKPTSKKDLRHKVAQLWNEVIILKAALKRERIHVRNLTRLIGAKNAR